MQARAMVLMGSLSLVLQPLLWSCALQPSLATLSLSVPESAPPTRVIILGNRKTGKSTLCQWLLASTDVCQVFDSISEHTTEMEFARGYWFNDSSLGELEVLDTPGFLSGDDADNWLEFVPFAKEHMSKIDALIFTSNPNGETGAFRHAIINKLRLSFGTDIWENMVKFVPARTKWQAPEIGEWDGMTQSTWQSIADYWGDTFAHVEFNESRTNWSEPHNAHVREMLQEEITKMPMIGSYLKTHGGSPMVQAHNPVYPGRTEAWTTKHLTVSRLRYLVDLRQHIFDKRELHGQWDIQHLQPRFGPSEVTPEQTFECNWPHSCELVVVGAYLSDADRLQLFPSSHTCGDDISGFQNESEWPVDYVAALPQLAGEMHNHRHFLLGSTRLPSGKSTTEYKVCYCEYGYCDTPGRFFQEAGVLSVQATQCEVPCPNEMEVHASLRGSCGLSETLLARTSLEYECHFGYGYLSNAEQRSFTRECGDNGALTAELQCSPVLCAAAPTIPGNAKRITIDNGQFFHYLDPVHFMCEESFTVNGNPEGPMRIDVQCGGTGEWKISLGGGVLESWNAFLASGGCRRWKTSDWDTCNAECGEGVHMRDVSCEPATAECNPLFKPIASRSCSGFSACPDCSVAPDLSASHAQLAYFADQAAPMVLTGGAPVHYDCDHHNGYTLTGGGGRSFEHTTFQASCKRHATEAKAVLEWRRADGSLMSEEDVFTKGCRRWETSEWGECSVTCGTGYRFRSIRCSTGIDADCPEEAKPRGVATSRSCYMDTECSLRGINSTPAPDAGMSLQGVAIAVVFLVSAISATSIAYFRGVW